MRVFELMSRPAHAGLVLLVGILAPLVFLTFVSRDVPTHVRKSARPQVASAAHACWTMAAAPLVFAASPQVTSPAELVAAFGVAALPAITGVVEARLVGEIEVTRIGGRHGP